MIVIIILEESIIALALLGVMVSA